MIRANRMAFWFSTGSGVLLMSRKDGALSIWCIEESDSLELTALTALPKGEHAVPLQ